MLVLGVDAELLNSPSSDLYPREPRDEKYARLALDHYWREEPAAAAVWLRGADPPDYQVRLREDIASVEVTRMMLPYPDGPDRSHPERYISVMINRICAAVHGKATARGVTSGHYALVFDEPFDGCRLSSAY